ARIAQDSHRVMERSDQVLGPMCVDPDLPPDRTVDLRHERGWNVEVRDSTHVRGSGEPYHVAQRRPPERDDHIQPPNTTVGQPVDDLLPGRERLDALAHVEG